MTTKEIQEQIDSVLREINSLPNDKLKSEQVKSLLAQIEAIQNMLSQASPMVLPPQLGEEQEKYLKDLCGAASSGHKKLNQKSTEVIVRFSDSQLSSDIEALFVGIDEFGIEFIDQEKTTAEIDRVNKKYEGRIKNGEIGGIGAGPLFGFIVNALVMWFIEKIFDRLSVVLWKKLKGALLGSFRLAKSLNPKECMSIFACSDPQVIFIIPLSMDENVAADQMEDIIKKTKEIKNRDKERKTAYRYTYSTEHKAWELETQNDSL